LQKELRQKSTHIKIATKTETKIDRHEICNKNSDKSTHIKIAVTEKNQYTQKLQQKLRENKKTHKNCKNCNKITHTHTNTQNKLQKL
jgi:predicted house-cleaning noncanonical NTP pyrophosphatase (MazG superfamily)